MLVLVAAALVGLALIQVDLTALVVAVLVAGFGAGLGLQASSVVVTQSVDDAVTALSASLNSATRRFAGGSAARSAPPAGRLRRRPRRSPLPRGLPDRLPGGAALAAGAAVLALSVHPADRGAARRG